MKYVIAGILMCNTALANDFNTKHYTIIKNIIAAADMAQVPRELLLAVCWGESNFRTDSKIHHIDGGSYSYGICQIKLATAKDMDKIYKHYTPITSEKLKIPFLNALYAGKYLKQKLIKYKGNWQLAVDAYNKGNAIGVHTKYVKKVERNLEVIKDNVKVQ